MASVGLHVGALGQAARIGEVVAGHKMLGDWMSRVGFEPTPFRTSTLWPTR